MAKKENKAAKKTKGLIAEFKKFISRGNVFDMAVGVVIGGAFSAIVTSVVNILMSICTWWLPGGIKGLVTVLPAANAMQEGMNKDLGLIQQFDASKLQELAKNLAISNYGETEVNNNLNLIEAAKTTILGKYTLHGTTYVYNLSACIDWGTLINAVISFLIIAVVLFIIVKAVNAAADKKKALEAKAQEAYYEKHPEERPAPVEPGVPAPTTEELLTQIRDLLKEKEAPAAAEK
ncbi:MAG: MscL family protein [Bacilli bacterium]|nr:MscL family protein [Bacilli bacterium]